VHDTPALTSEGRQAMDSNTRLAGNLPQPGQLARPVLENHCQVCGHRIFDPSTAPRHQANPVITHRFSATITAPAGALITAGYAAMRYLVATEAPDERDSGYDEHRPGLDRPGMASWTPEHQPARISALAADYRVRPTRRASPRAIRRYVARLGRSAASLLSHPND
jgi:hypothetical protein